MDTQTPYLDAIQAIPGTTAGEKFKWIANLIKQRILESKSLEELVESDQIPRPLAPLVQMQAVKMLIKKRPNDQSIYEAISEALKSEDATIVNKALQVNNFFNGSNEIITSVKYFFDNLFPYVSLRTRKRIIKNLAIHLSPKHTALAEEFFPAIASTYGLDQALPLLPACSEDFMYNTIVEKRIVLNQKLVKTIYRKNPDFLVRYFRLSKPGTAPHVRNLHPVNLHDFSEFLGALIKKRLESFVELYEMHEDSPPSLSLSYKCIDAFLKKGWDYFQRKPKLYIKLIPLNMISATRMEAIYTKLFPENIKDFKTERMWGYLAYYPQDKKLDLFLKSYSKVYGKNLLDDPSKVTADVIRMLPTEERIWQARIKLAEGYIVGRMDYTHTWRCYMPVKETIPEIKEEIAKCPEMENRAALLCQMIYCCRVNNDDQGLLDVLTYVRDRHKNEQPWFLLRVFECLLALYELPKMTENCWAILTDLILRIHVKNELIPLSSTSVNIVEAAIHYRIIHNQLIDQFIGIFVDLMSKKFVRKWNILENYPEYERMCLEACIAKIYQRYSSDNCPAGILFDLTSSIYRFNSNHVKRNPRIMRMSVKNYPWLLIKIKEIISKNDQEDVYIIQNFRELLEAHEKELFAQLFPQDKKKRKIIEQIESGKAVAVLKRSPEAILAEWKEYLKACQDNWYSKGTSRFVRSTRWYKDIPVKFTRQCLQDLTEEKKGICLEILAVLVHGHTLAKIIEPLMPINIIDIHQEEAKTTYDFTHYILTSIKSANPPVSLQLIGRLCQGDYLSMALIALTNVCIRTALLDVISFARTLVNQRVSVRKHGIRIMHMVAPRSKLYDFILVQWKTEKNYSIRDILFSKAKELFRVEPGPNTWSLLNQMVSTLTIENQSTISSLIKTVPTIPDQYILDFIKLLLKIIDRFAENGMAENVATTSISSLLDTIDVTICNILPEEFIEELLRKFLFHSKTEIAQAAGKFTCWSYLLAAKDKLDSRLDTFSKIFVEAVKRGWDVPHPKKSHYYPVNYAIHELVSDLVSPIGHVDVQPRLIDGILKAFLSTLSPKMDPASYLLLVFTKELLSARTPKEFGLHVGRKMPELISIFTQLFLPFITKTLKNMISTTKFKKYDLESTKLELIKGLMEVGSLECMLVAIELFTETVSKENVETYDKLAKRFLEYDHPAINSTLCDLINRRSFESCPFDA